jgi:hypothetical protein
VIAIPASPKLRLNQKLKNESISGDRPSRTAEHGEIHPVQPVDRFESTCGELAGKTVERRSGIFSFEERSYDLVDLPGTYSLTANSPEEVIAREFILREKPDVVIAVVSAANLERSLYLVSELVSLRHL